MLDCTGYTIGELKMTLPKISTDCLLATISKMSQVPRQEFAADVMTDLAINSPELMGALTALLSGLWNLKTLSKLT